MRYQRPFLIVCECGRIKQGSVWKFESELKLSPEGMRELKKVDRKEGVCPTCHLARVAEICSASVSEF